MSIKGVKMKLTCCVLFLLGTSTVLPAQITPPSPGDFAGKDAGQAQPAETSVSSIQPVLDRLQSFATQSSQDLAGLQIDRWKATGATKSAAQLNADSVRSNLTGALPRLIEAARAAPDDVNAAFKLYRNVVALYEPFGTVTDATRIYGQKSQYDELSAQYKTLSSVRRSLGEALEELTASTQSQLRQMRVEIKSKDQQVASAQAAAADARQQVVLAQAELAKKTTPKKKTTAKKPASTAGSSPANPGAPAASTQTSSAASSPKQ
jgi:hypothetical protein